MKKCVFLCIAGDYDDLHEPTVITPGWDYICFTNNSKLKSKNWEIRFVNDDEGVGNQKFSRKIWILNHRHVGEYDISISIGGSMHPNCDLDNFIKIFLPADEKIDMAMHDRKIREGVYHEASKCMSKRKADPELIKRQMAFYRKEGLPKDTGIFSTGIIIRKHNRPNLERHCELWWEQVKEWAHRDQLSLNYILWKYNLVNISFFYRDILRGKGNYFQKYKHKRKRRL